MVVQFPFIQDEKLQNYTEENTGANSVEKQWFMMLIIQDFGEWKLSVFWLLCVSLTSFFPQLSITQQTWWETAVLILTGSGGIIA